MDGVLVLDKPAGLSSAAAVDRVKRALRATRAGHGGTLDPIATGVLAVCLGAATKLAPYLLADDKSYEADGVLGIETDTLDRTGRVVTERPVAVTEAALRAALTRRLGEQDQIPPAYSAIKQDGVRMYERARAGETVELQPRRIRIDRLELLSFAPPRFRIAVACSKGTYIRSLVADLGTDVGCGAHLAELRRTCSGRFRIEDAITLERVESLGRSLGRNAPVAAGAPGSPSASDARAELLRHLVPLAAATGLPNVVVPANLLGPVRSGVQLTMTALTSENLQQFQLIDEAGRLVALAHAERGRVVYDRVLAVASEA